MCKRTRGARHSTTKSTNPQLALSGCCVCLHGKPTCRASPGRHASASLGRREKSERELEHRGGVPSRAVLVHARGTGAAEASPG